MKIQLAVAMMILVFALLMGGRLMAADLLLMTENYPPYNYVIKKGDREELTGFCADVVREIQRRAGNRSPIKTMIWTQAYEELLKTPNSALFAMGKNPMRQKELKLVGEIGMTDYVLFARADKEINIVNLDDAKSYRIGTYDGDIAGQFLREQRVNNLLIAQTDEMNLDRLLSGEIDLWIVSDLKGWMIADNKGIPADKLKVVFVAFQSPLYIGFNKDTPAGTIEAWQKALDSMRDDGWYGKLRDEWVKKLSDGKPNQ